MTSCNEVRSGMTIFEIRMKCIFSILQSEGATNRIWMVWVLRNVSQSGTLYIWLKSWKGVNICSCFGVYENMN